MEKKITEKIEIPIEKIVSITYQEDKEGESNDKPEVEKTKEEKEDGKRK